MAPEKVSFGNCIIFALALAEVTSWTIDLPEVRKYFFEKHEREKKYEEYKYKTGEEIDGQYFYSNIEGNSKHNSKHREDVYDDTAYAREYGYQSYMEKKVHGIVYEGSVYLEGLRRALENYTEFLESCNRTMSSLNESSSQSNSTSWRPAVESSYNSTTERDAGNSTDSDRRVGNSTNTGNSTRDERCREATRSSERVRRLSELATWATRELQDIAYARKYKKGDYHRMSEEENELILKLAWFLDRLAHYTGYEPQPRDFVEKQGEPSAPSITTTVSTSLMNPPEEVARAMMDCLKGDSSTPADERCRYPESLPPAVQMMMEMNSNITGIPMPTSSSNQNEQTIPITSESRSVPLSEQSMELLIASDNRMPNLPPYSNFRHVQKRSVLSMPQAEVTNAPVSKRSIEDDPAINFLKYYAKHKVWEGSNLKNAKGFEEYEVKNHLATHKIQKRAIDKKSKHLQVPENPFQDLSKYIKHKPGVNYVKDETQAEKIRDALEKMKYSKNKDLLRKLTKIHRQKRAIEYEKDVDLPRESVDPQKDISYYVKNKPGRTYENNLVQAGQVRAGLQQVFNTPNAEVVRRFGANYNPLIPAPFFFGIIKSMADF